MSKTIVVADDSKTIRHVVGLTFHSSGFRVVPASSAKEAVDKLSKEQADLVLADVGMPGTDGYQLCEQLKQDARTAHIPVVLMAGPSEPFDERRANAARADGHIKKPFDSGTLIEQVKKLTGEKAAAPQPPSFAESLAARGSTPAPTNGGQAQAARGGQPSPFGPPRQEASPAAAAPARAQSQRGQAPTAQATVDEPLAAHAGFGGPSLEPPTPPTAEQEAQRRKVDMWALSEEGAAGRHDEPVEEVDVDLRTPTPAPGRAAAKAAAQAVAEHAAEPVAAAVASHVPGLSRDELLVLAKKTIEEIAWEVVPELAETIIREEIRRLLRDR